MKFFTKVVISTIFYIAMSNNTYYNTFATDTESLAHISEYEAKYDTYFNKRLDSQKANDLLYITQELYNEYINIGNYKNAEDALNRQIKYAEYLGIDTSDIYQKMESLNHTSDLYILSNDPLNKVNFRQKFEGSFTYFGINSNTTSTLNGQANEIAVIDVNFPSDDIKTVLESKYSNIANSTIYINMNVQSLDITLSDIYNYKHYEYFVHNIEYLATLQNNVIFNLNFDDVEILNCDLYKNVQILISNLIRSTASNVAIVNNYTSDFNYYAGDEYFDWIGTSLTIDNTNQEFKSTTENIRQHIEQITSVYNKPIILTDIEIKYSHIYENDSKEAYISKQIQEIHDYATMLNPQMKGVIYNNKNGDLANHVDDIKIKYTSDILKNGTYVDCVNYNFNNPTIYLSLYSTSMSETDIYVTYDLNGTRVFESNELPFNYVMDTNHLNMGENTLKVGITGNNGFRQILNYTVEKTAEGFITLDKLVDTSVNTSESEVFVKPSTHELPVNNVLQYPELPTGCEVTALTALLNYLDYDVSKTTMASDFMPRGAIGSTDPSVAFVGNPEVKSAYGCNAPVIVETANKYFESIGAEHTAYDITGATYDELTTYVAKGYPVLVWETMYMVPSYNTARWVIGGNTIYWKANLHCVVLTGYTPENYIIADPLVGVVEYSRSLVETRYMELGNQAIIIADCPLEDI